LGRPYYLSGGNTCRKIRERKRRTDIGNYSFANRDFQNWNHLPAEDLGLSLVNIRFLEKKFWKAIIKRVK